MKFFLLFSFTLLLSNNFVMASQNKVLIILSEKSQLPLKDGSTHKTGFFLNELMIPVMELTKKGYTLIFSTPNGKRPELDHYSDSARYFKSEEEYLNAKQLLKEIGLLSSSKNPVISFKKVLQVLDSFKGVLIPGGHAPMIDLAFSKELGEILKHFHQKNKPTALLCHGPVALLSALKSPKLATLGTTKENWIYRGYQMTVFSNAEEGVAEKNKLKGEVLFYPADALKNAGANLKQGEAWKSNVVKHKELITGQNPASDGKFIEMFLNALSK